jgi:hypothetical protein
MYWSSEPAGFTSALCGVLKVKIQFQDKGGRTAKWLDYRQRMNQ